MGLAVDSLVRTHDVHAHGVQERHHVLALGLLRGVGGGEEVPRQEVQDEGAAVLPTTRFLQILLLLQQLKSQSL